MVVQDTNGDALCSVCGRKFRPKYLNDSSHNCVKNGVHYPGRVCPTCWNKREICPICGENVHPDYIGHIIETVVSGIPQQPATSANEQIDTEEEELMNLTREDVEAMLIKLYSSDVYNRLVARREHKAFLELFGKARLENGISSFLVWLFGNKQLNTITTPPLLHLLRLIAFKSLPDDENDTPKLDSELRDQILINRIEISAVEVRAEDVIENGRADMKITITYKLRDGICKSSSDTNDSDKQKLVLIIENKIDSTEGENQCERYEKHYTCEAEKANSKVAFVFLSVTQPKKLTSKKFIKITHQDILDRVLQPLLVHSNQFSTEILRYIEAYIDSITSFNPDDKKPPIAMDESLSNLLIAFFDENESLIKAAIEAKKQADPNYGSLANDLNNLTKGRSRTNYEVCQPIKTTVSGHTALVYTVVSDYAATHTADEVQAGFNVFNIPSGYKCVYKSNEKPSDPGRYNKKEVKCSDNVVVYCNNQWVPEVVDAFIDAAAKLGYTINKV